MRTDGLTRRGFVSSTVTGGVLLGIGSASAAADPVVVEATAPYREPARRLAETVESERDLTVEVREADRDTPDAAVRIAGSPPDVWANAPGRDVAPERELRAVGARGWATLANPDGEWRECVAPGTALASVADGPVETWIESDRDSVDDLARVDPETAGHTVLVHGTRSSQYARGSGGPGFYTVAPAAVDAPKSVPSGTDDATPVFKLEYLSVASGRRGSIRALLRHYDRQVVDPSDFSSALPAPSASIGR